MSLENIISINKCPNCGSTNISKELKDSVVQIPCVSTKEYVKQETIESKCLDCDCKVFASKYSQKEINSMVKKIEMKSISSMLNGLESDGYNEETLIKIFGFTKEDLNNWKNGIGVTPIVLAFFRMIYMNNCCIECANSGYDLDK